MSTGISDKNKPIITISIPEVRVTKTVTLQNHLVEIEYSNDKIKELFIQEGNWDGGKFEIDKRLGGMRITGEVVDVILKSFDLLKPKQ